MTQSGKTFTGRKGFLTVATALGVLLAASATALAESDHARGVQEAAPPSWGEALLFYLFAGITLGSGLAICLSKNIVRMAVYLFGTLAAVAVLYFLLLANFIAVIQLIVYAGGTLILLIFGVMLTSKSPWARFDVKRGEIITAAVVCGVLAVALLAVVAGAAWPTESAAEGPTVRALGTELLSTYLVPFEAVSVLLLVVMIGAALLARQES